MSTCLSETDVDEFLASHLGPEANARVEAHLAKCDNRRTYLSFAEVIVVRHVRVIQERKDVLAIAAQTFGQSPGVGIRMFFPGHFTDPAVQPVDPALIPLGREVRTLPQADAVTQQPAQLLGERPPLGTVVVLIHLLQFAQQMGEALLPIGRVNRIVRRPEVGDQNTVEGFSEELLHDGTAPAALNGVIAVSIIGETPPPTQVNPRLT